MNSPSSSTKMMIAIVADRTCGQVRPGHLPHLRHHAVVERDEPRISGDRACSAGAAGGATSTAITWFPCAPDACCSAGSTSSTRRAPGWRRLFFVVK